MSDERRKSLRTQGRFSAEKDHKPPGNRDKDKRYMQRSSQREKSDKNIFPETSDFNKHNIKNGKSIPQSSEEGSNLQYEEHSKYTFTELETQQKPYEIKEQGEYVLSEGDNGKSKVIYEPDFIPEDEASELFENLLHSTKWNEKSIVMKGVEYPQPRLVAWYGPFQYAYSGAILEPCELPPKIVKIKDKVEQFLLEKGIEVTLNSVLLNLYRGAKDSVAWHSDDEVTMGIRPTIASVSLGEVRKFEMRPKIHISGNNNNINGGGNVFVNLKAGSLIIMDGCMQKDWQHRVPKEYHDKNTRINLTFRTVYAKKLPPQVPLKNSKNCKEPFNRKRTEPVFDSEDFPALNANGAETSSSKREVFPGRFSSRNFTRSKENVDECQNSSKCSLEDDRFPGNVQNLVMDQNISSVIDHCQQSEVDLSINESYTDQEAMLPLYGNNEYQILNTGSNLDCSNVIQNRNIEHYMQNEIFDCGGNTSSYINSNNQDASNINGNEFRNTELKSNLNVDAPDFIPKGQFVQPTHTYEDMSLVDFALHVLRCIKNEDPYVYSEVFIKKLKSFDSSILGARDRIELDVLSEISDGSQTYRNQEIILKRMCTVVRLANDRRPRNAYENPNRHTTHGFSSNRLSAPRREYSYNRNRVEHAARFNHV